MYQDLDFMIKIYEAYPSTSKRTKSTQVVVAQYRRSSQPVNSEEELESMAILCTTVIASMMDTMLAMLIAFELKLYPNTSTFP